MSPLATATNVKKRRGETRARRREQRKKRRGLPLPRVLRELIAGEGSSPVDTPMVVITIMLLIIGLIALLSASYPEGYYSTDENIGPFYYFARQAVFALLGLVGMGIVSRIYYKRYRVWANALYLLAAVLLVLVLTPLGTSLNGSQRWLFGFQPSEIAKLAIIVLFAAKASRDPKGVLPLKGLAQYVGLIAVLALLLAKEPHMSAAMILAVVGVSILFVAGMRLRYIGVVGVLGGIVAVVSYFVFPHVQDRLNVFLDPFSDAMGDGWQACQSFIAIGSGGLLGQGLGQSRQKFLYLPEPMNDFIFSVVCEELGFIGAALILALFAYFVYRGFTIARRAPDRFSCLLATGITMQFAFQILLNLAVVSGLFPVTGASLPLFSYGGTALIMQLLEIGILLNISRHIPPSKKD